MFHLSHRASLSFFEHTRSVFTLRKSIAVEEPKPTVRNKGQRCLSRLLGVDYVSSTSGTSVARFVAMGRATQPLQSFGA